MILIDWSPLLFPPLRKRGRRPSEGLVVSQDWLTGSPWAGPAGRSDTPSTPWSTSGTTSISPTSETGERGGVDNPVLMGCPGSHNQFLVSAEIYNTAGLKVV